MAGLYFRGEGLHNAQTDGQIVIGMVGICGRVNKVKELNYLQAASKRWADALAWLHGCMAIVHFTGRHWAFIQPFLPPPTRTGRLRAEDRRTVEGILYVLITSCWRQDLPREYGAPTTV
jgi:hypothetical protein